MDRILDPKWGVDSLELIREFSALGTKIFVPGRLVDGVFMTCNEVLWKHKIINLCGELSPIHPGDIFIEVKYRLDISSTEIRVKNEYRREDE